jgi:serine/threonine-protein kinase HipA
MNEHLCLCCSKPLEKEEIGLGWHRSCIRKFFGTDAMPSISLSQKDIESLAKEAVSKGLSIPGVQEKLSLSLKKGRSLNSRLTIVGYPTGYILKPQSPDYPLLPESEQLVMAMADTSHIKTCPHGLINLADSSLAYISKRIDRIISKEGNKRIPMEDFCQLGLFPSSGKYMSSYEKCFKVIDSFSAVPQADKAELFYRLLFCFVTGNSDMHLKNFSLIEKEKGIYVLSPAYDLLPVNLVMPADKEETALTLLGKKKSITRNNFLELGEKAGLSAKASTRMIEEIISYENSYEGMISSSLLTEKAKEEFSELLKKRINALKGL